MPTMPTQVHNNQNFQSYLRVNLAKVLIGFDSRKEPFRLNRRLMALFPSEILSIKDVRRFSPLILNRTFGYTRLNTLHADSQLKSVSSAFQDGGPQIESSAEEASENFCFKVKDNKFWNQLLKN